MASEEGRSRGTKRSRPEDSLIGETSDLQFAGIQSRPKRARTDDDDKGLIRNIVGSVFTWFSERFQQFRGSGTDTGESENMNCREDDQPIDMRRRPSPELGGSKEDEDHDDIQVVDVKLCQPKPLSPSQLNFGSISYGPLFQRKHREFRIATKEKRAKDKLNSSPKSILSQVKQARITAVKKPSSIQSFWLQHIGNDTIRRQFPLQKTIARNRTPKKVSFENCVQREDYLKYSTILYANNQGVESNPNAIRSSLKPKSLFAKKETTTVIVAKPATPKVAKDPEPEKSRPEVVDLGDDEDEDEVKEVFRKSPSTPATASVSITKSPPRDFKPKQIGPDSDVIEIVNLYSPPPTSPSNNFPSRHRSEFKEELELNKVVQEDFLSELRKKYDHRREETKRLLKEEEVSYAHSQERIRKLDKTIEERLREHLKISEVDIPEPPSPPPEEEEEEEEEALPEMTSEMEDVIESSLRSSGTLIDAYKISISRKDLDTLRGLNWLNDEIINFYLQMIVDRSTRHDNWPKVYAMNTFFYPKLMQSGHAALKRWTRKVDIFAHDLIVIPVHLGMHWCLATIDLKKKGVYYYDSMGGNNTQCLTALLKYLEDEHLDKKKTSFDVSGFEAEIVKDIPQQMNGSDCGMFTCKFSEYLSRNAAITFSQEDMPYFRRRMIWEIVKNTILHP